MKDFIKEIVHDVLPRKSAFDAIAESGTTAVWMQPRLRSLPKKYIYGKTPELYEAQKKGKGFYPKGRPRPIEHGSAKVNWRKELALESGSHFAKCEPEESGGDEIWKMCRLLKNPKRMKLLLKIYWECRDRGEGCNVGNAQVLSGLELSATSEYLKDLAGIGLISRRRYGKMVVYYPDFSRAKSAVRRFGQVLRSRVQSKNCDLSFVAVFPSLSNASRARAIKLLSDEGQVDRVSLCRMLRKPSKNINRDLLPLKKAGLIDYGSEDPDAVIVYLPPKNPIIQMLIDLVK